MAGIEGYSVTPGSNNANSPLGWPEGMAPSGVNDSDRAFAAAVRSEWAITSLTATATLSIGNNAAGVGAFIHVITDPNKSISSFDTISAGIRRVLIFDVPAILVHHATKLICPELKSLPMGPNDACTVVSEGSGNWRVVGVARAGDMTYHVKNFGVVGDGATNDTAAFLLACQFAAGKTLDIGDDLTIKLTGASPCITLTAGLRIVGRSTFIHPKDATAIRFLPAVASTATTLSAVGVATQFPNFTGNLSTPLNVGSIASLTRGDVVMISSQDKYGFAAGTNKGELARILETTLSGGSVPTIYVHGIVQDTYSAATAIVTKLGTEAFEIDGATFKCDEDPYAATGSSFHLGALQVVGAVRPRIRNVTFRDDTSAGLTLISCWAPQVEVTAYSLRDDSANNNLGYGVIAYGACRNGRIRVKAERVRHAFTTGVWGAVGGDVRFDGTVRDMTITGECANSTAASWDTHPGSFDVSFVNCLANWQGGATSTGVVYGFQDRGCGTKFINCHEVGIGYGWSLQANLSPHARENITTIQNCSSTNLSGSATAPLITAAATSAGVTDTIVTRVHNSAFTRNTLSLTDGSGTFEFYDCAFISVATLRLGASNTVRMLGCRRLNIGSANVEPIIVDASSTLTIDDYFAQATSFGNTSLLRTGSTAGTATMNIGRLTSVPNASATPTSTNIAALSLNYMSKPDWRSVSADKGDAAMTAVVGTDEQIIVYNTPLTAGRTISLSGAGAYKGAGFKVVRTANATGAFNLSVGGLKNLTAGQFAEVVYDGSAFILLAFGSL